MRRHMIISPIVTFALLMVVVPSVLGQPSFIRDYHGIPMFRSGNQIDHPWTGGFYNPSHQFADLDGDGDFDLIQLDVYDGSVAYFQNIGTAQSPIFRETRPTSFVFPSLRAWFRVSDIDGNGTIDLMTAGDSINSVRIYRNDGTPQSPLFNLWVPTLRDSSGRIVFAQEQCIPAFADIDGDGDLDFFSLNPGEGTINFYQNIGSAISINLAFRAARWQNIQICPGCGGLSPNAHGAGSMFFADIDADGDRDLFYGDLFDPGLFFYNNSGTPQVPSMDSVSGHFPASNPILTGGFNQPTLVDIDNDGDLDMFVSVLTASAYVDNFWFYRNTGAPSAYQFTLESKNFLTTFDIGGQSAPAFVDIDNDGDFDLFVGGLLGQVAFVRNEGANTSPSFVFEDSTFIDSYPNRFVYVPRFVDIDADGDKDMFLAHFNGNIEFYRNTGSASNFAFQREFSHLDSINVGFYAAGDFCDIDGDGDQDLFVGSGNGRIRFYRNEGTPQVFSFVQVTTSFEGIQVSGNSKPFFADFDSDGDFDLVVGTTDGKLIYYRNDGSPTTPTFVHVTDTFVSDKGPLGEAAPFFADIDGDNDLDLFLGSYRGGLEFYRQVSTAVTITTKRQLPESFVLHQNYPNPFNPSTTIEFDLREEGRVTVAVFDLLGRRVATLLEAIRASGLYQIQWNAESVGAGTYFYRIEFVPASGRVLPLPKTLPMVLLR